MANEIWHSYDEIPRRLYALIWRQSDTKIYDQGIAHGADELFTTYTDDDIDNYFIVLSNRPGIGGVGTRSDFWATNFPPDILAGTYYVQIMLQESEGAGNPHADNDIAVAQGVMYWDGEEEITVTNMMSVQARVLNVYDDREK